jgi:beta-lactamase class A
VTGVADALEARVREIADGLEGRLGLVVRSLGGTDLRLELNGGEAFPAASVIKLAILWSFFEAVDHGELDPAEPWTLESGAAVGGTGVLRLLGDGLRLGLLDLATLMIVVSDNTATNAVIDRLGLGRIEAAVGRLGLRGTALRRKMLDFAARDRGLDNWTTPEDTARLLARFATGEGLSRASAERAGRILLGQQFNHKLAGRLPPGAALAHKTGELPGLEHDAGWLEVGGSRVVIAAFTRDLRHNADGVAALAEIGGLVAARLTRDR